MIASALSIALAVTPFCQQPGGAKITADDVARAAPAFAKLPGALVISYAPQPGFVRHLSPAELNGWLSRHGEPGEIREPVCFSWKMDKPDTEAMRISMLAALPSGSELTMIEVSQYDVPNGVLAFPLGGLQRSRAGEPTLWKGLVRYSDSAQAEVWARVELRIPFQRVVAVEEIKPGMTVEPSMVRVDSGSGPPLLPDIATDPATVAGRVARRLIPSGSAVPLSALGKAQSIRKGDLVHVKVVSGAAQLSFDGTAESPAGPGDSIPIRMADTGKLIRVRVLEAGRAVLDLTPEGKP